FTSKGKLIDGIFIELRKIKEPLTEDKLKRIIRLHGKFVDILRKMARDKNTVRSFASKYMHFHCPAVPIFDNVALGVIRRRDWYPLTNRKIEKLAVSQSADDIYYDYCRRFFAMYKDLNDSGLPVGVRRLDNYLLWSNEE
ncbi:MAG TPA: hypothetical protein VF790_12855, partial [Dissulfurispiraceae bacterium]